MQINYTQHAETRMAERGISKAEVEATLHDPVCTLPAQNGRTESQGWIERAGKRQSLVQSLPRHSVLETFKPIGKFFKTFYCMAHKAGVSERLQKSTIIPASSPRFARYFTQIREVSLIYM